MPTPFHIRHACKRHALLQRRASAMRACGTESERRLWRCLVNGKLGVPFRRQYVIGERIADFVALSVRLVVEVDGASHVGRERADARRERELRLPGYRVLRVAASQVMRDLDAVLAEIRRALGRA
jgi:very-short-patch-repair endonuclease